MTEPFAERWAGVFAAVAVVLGVAAGVLPFLLVRQVLANYATGWPALVLGAALAAPLVLGVAFAVVSGRSGRREGATARTAVVGFAGGLWAGVVLLWASCILAVVVSTAAQLPGSR